MVKAIVTQDPKGAYGLLEKFSKDCALLPVWKIAPGESTASRTTAEEKKEGEGRRSLRGPIQMP